MNEMNELKKLVAEYFTLKGKCDGTAETFAALHPLAKDLAKRAEDLWRKAMGRDVRYFAFKLYQDVSDMKTRFWKYTSWYTKGGN